MDNDNGSQNDTGATNGSGIQPGTPGTNDVTPGSIANQNGQGASGQPQPGQPDLSEENRRLKGQITALQRQMIQSRRSQGNPSLPQSQGQGDPNADPAQQVQQQIAIAYEIADGQLRRQMDAIYELYPELTAQELNQIRRNPWAYCSRETFMQGDVETAKLEIEQYIANLVESRTQPAPAPQVPSGMGVNPAPAPRQAAQAAPGTPEDEDPWTMPMADLEKKVQKIKANSGK